jgi:F-type H+-transporting ATPase subunit b
VNFLHLAVKEPQNPILPVWSELVIGLICFLIVFGVLAKKLLPTINKVLEERYDLIEGGMERAERAQAEAQETLESYRAKLSEAKHEAAGLTQKAQEQGAAQIAEMREEGQRQRDTIVAAGHTQIEADRQRTAGALRADLGALSIELAGRIVGESLEDEARQRRIVDRFLDELEARAAESEQEQVSKGSVR